MRASFRTLAALLALLAFAASFAEQVWAATCPPAAVRSSGGARAEMGPHPGHVRGGAGITAEHPVQNAPHPGDACPLQAAAGGCAVVSLPSAPTPSLLPEPRPAGAVPVHQDRTPKVLRAVPFFRPPRR